MQLSPALSHQKQGASVRIKLNDINHLPLCTSTPMLFGRYKYGRRTCNFLIIEEFTHATAGADMSR